MADDLQHLAAGYALDALAPGERIRAEGHLDSSERWSEDLPGLVAAACALAFAVPSAEPPATLRARILRTARTDRETVRHLPRRHTRLAVGAAATAAAGLALGVGLGFWADKPSGAPRATAVAGTPGALVVTGLKPAPERRTYEIWSQEGGVPVPAGLFNRGGLIRLDRPLARGMRIEVTIERFGGAKHPTSPVLFAAVAR